ncbi:hypothetical protein WEB32_11180 [Streptomyces netropsis]|uniref:Uncharacterized protein n=1 Tax=Streptomyces netropsis TaxID=55404 RepID=A0A7W7L7E6_STRNE|nr:hypothetical protein [Streptomyces netropsis]MBB4884396.1 hypothetical protein [Streptomyces netropsis]GGR03979.1 hypothetical protein GCM10010219_05160 [Streptomyces netropsis]
MAVVGGLSALVAVPGVIFGLWYQDRSTKAGEDSAKIAREAEDREKGEAAEDKKKEAGPPIASVAGAPAFYGARFAFPGRTTDLADGKSAVYGTDAYAKWFAKNRVAPVGVEATRITLSPLHEGTVVVQNMRIADLKCQPTRYAGTAVVPPPIGDGGEEIEPTEVVFDLTEPVPRPRRNEGKDDSGSATKAEVWRAKGNAFSKGIYLDGGKQADSRSFDLYFFTGTNDCEFGVEVNITSGTSDGWYPVKLGDGYKTKVAGQAQRYESVVLPTNNGPADPVQNELHGPGNPFQPLKLEKGPF